MGYISAQQHDAYRAKLNFVNCPLSKLYFTQINIKDKLGNNILK